MKIGKTLQVIGVIVGVLFFALAYLKVGGWVYFLALASIGLIYFGTVLDAFENYSGNARKFRILEVTMILLCALSFAFVSDYTHSTALGIAVSAPFLVLAGYFGNKVKEKKTIEVTILMGKF
ncbi:hypothetical protein A3L04_01880 [Thermococcus chitonophagus]|uniref:Phosphatidate cytidylyltransferase n=1 Tax=Thermococcus chitonophagus TaxID=54262 RepID=A0A160VQU8_9EURY|nr:hypothetical protein [Thermococcus chitonophagus]ASJ15909.1 hypothetical protein A3L04_01880 [Thermococcus chitonophagus]CUX77152.1 hypothetical protein CHITON_0373 [Thermococcus chitonophagus]